MAFIEPKTLKGFRDFLPVTLKKRNYVINTLKKAFELYGFDPLETPSLEYEEILTGKYGNEGEKLMYRFQDNGQRKVAMRYDQTVPLARAVAQYQSEIILPFKRFQIQNVWRAENTQKGRYREFLQVDADIVGTYSPIADAEILAVLITSLKQLGFESFKVFLNDRMIFTGLSQLGVPNNKIPVFIRTIDKLKKIGKEKVMEELISSGIDKDNAKYLLDTLSNQKPTTRILEIISAVTKMGIDNKYIEFLPTLARGLDYYTGLIFEVEIDGYQTGSVAGGGRYDNLIGTFSGRDIPAVGFAFGFDRLIEAMEELNLFPDNINGVNTLVAFSNSELQEKALEITTTLRANSINSDFYPEDTTLEKQLKYADKKLISYVIIVSDSYLNLKNMKTGEQKEHTLEQIIQILNA